MEKALELMSLSKFRYSTYYCSSKLHICIFFFFVCFRKKKDEKPEVNFFLFFSNRQLELPFLLRPDPLFNLYILGIKIIKIIPDH